ncbi:MAG: DUF2183 domain-containing protein [Candidatus Riflebacteria bacterium]|nr:DUF2183 domain-containing protein [Candidatus Riflebacteria bacterium]
MRKITSILLVLCFLSMSNSAFSGGDVPRLIHSGFLPLPNGCIMFYGRLIWDELENLNRPLADKHFSEFFRRRVKEFPLQLTFGRFYVQTCTNNIGDFEGIIPAYMANELYTNEPIVFSSCYDPNFYETRVFNLPKAPSYLIVSDLDDTAEISNVLEKMKLLENEFLKNWRKKKSVPGIPELYRELVYQNYPEAQNLLVFLTQSPIYFGARIEGFLDLNYFPPHSSLLSRMGIKEDFFDKFFHKTHGDADPLDVFQYKVSKFYTLLRLYPDLPVILFGDSGQKDPEVFQRVIELFPGRVRAVAIRNITWQGIDSPRYNLLRTEVPLIVWTSSQFLKDCLKRLGLINSGNVNPGSTNPGNQNPDNKYPDNQYPNNLNTGNLYPVSGQYDDPLSQFKHTFEPITGFFSHFLNYFHWRLHFAQ